jgi:hypothetical protein
MKLVVVVLFVAWALSVAGLAIWMSDVADTLSRRGAFILFFILFVSPFVWLPALQKRIPVRTRVVDLQAEERQREALMRAAAETSWTRSTGGTP